MVPGGIFGLAMFALWAYCIFDVIRTDEASVQNLPKMVWLLVTIFVPTIGSLAWLLLGRPSAARFELRPPQMRRPAPPRDTPPAPGPSRTSSADHAAKREEALRKYMAEREEELRKREEDIRRREELLRKDRPPDAAGEGDAPQK